MAHNSPLDVPRLLKNLNREEKVKLLAGDTTWTTAAIDRLAIPAITVSDGPHGVRGTRFFNSPPGCLLPAATAMGATFDTALMKTVGEMLADEAKDKGCQLILAPTVCLQRSPLMGRGFEAFGEDPWLSGTMAAAYINGVQCNGVGVSIKHYAAHDQSSNSIEDSLRMSERTLREMHLYPFQIAVKQSNPWSFMTGYHKINGLHVPENPLLLDQILRREWGWDGLVMSDWFGTYSCADSVNAGLDLEMPGPTRWRGDLLTWAIMSRQVKMSTIDDRVRNVLNLINKVQPSLNLQDRMPTGDTEGKRAICRKVAADSIVLLKNERKVLPLSPTKKQTYGLIGPNVSYPAISGGGSADLTPYYVSRPLEAIAAVVGHENVKTVIGAYGHRFTPVLDRNITVPGKQTPGYLVEWFAKDPLLNKDLGPLSSTITVQGQMFFADNLPKEVPSSYFLKAQTTYTAQANTVMQIGLCVIGRARLYVDGKEVIDLYTSHPEKTHATPMFNAASMEKVGEISMEAGRQYAITVILANDSVIPGMGALNAGGLRIGLCPKFSAETALSSAIALAKEVDIPIVIAGLNADYETEAADRENLDLPPGIDNLITSILSANPNTVIITQSGTPILMPWVSHAPTVLHAWFGGQETGHAIADVLFGMTNPSGRLSLTFPARLEETPSFLTFGKADRELYYGEGVFLGYRYAEKLKFRPMFWLGYGLSYTSFSYSNLQMPAEVMLDEQSNKTFRVSVDVRNDGELNGAEVVQFYVRDHKSAVQRPEKELKGFTKVFVPAGKTVRAEVELDKYALSFWSEEDKAWVAEQGTFSISIGRSADPDDEVLSQDFELQARFVWNGI